MTRRKGRMGDLGDETFKRTDKELSDEEARVLLISEANWNELRPMVTDPELYDELISEVLESTRKNENLARLKGRIEKLGEKGIKMAKEVIDLI